VKAVTITGFVAPWSYSHPARDILYLLWQVIYLRLLMIHSPPRGQGLVEYALLILLVGIAVIVLLALFGTGVGNMFSNIVANF
jgi:Flp pilus assembly pilin Flp